MYKTTLCAIGVVLLLLVLRITGLFDSANLRYAVENSRFLSLLQIRGVGEKTAVLKILKEDL